ncbi:L-rhamnose-binding lectin CSL3-like [Anarhichas minor]|uniref:L-rhamnose-binding lectin CSL3-like n=1 Tax=Anarhichas minor TaxID=65739 RepID=UPI003F738176
MIGSIEVNYGVKSDADCADRKKPAKVSDGNSLHTSMKGWIQRICDRREWCRLPKPNRRMFVDNNSQDNFLQITYDCEIRPAEWHSIVACENQTAEIKCEKGEVKIVNARFGRFDENTCTKTPSKMTFCTSFKAADRVKDKCSGTPVCYVTATPDNLGSPVGCDSHPKYLSVDYECEEND